MLSDIEQGSSEMGSNQSSSRSASGEFSWGGFFFRLIGTATLIFATYNPSGWSYVHWIRDGMATGTMGPAHFVVGILLVIGWIILVTATQKSMGILGLALGAALFGGLVWLLIDIGWLSIDSQTDITWVVLVVLSLLLAIGLSWAHFWRRLTGQYSTDDTD